MKLRSHALERSFALLALMLAGESIYMLPYMRKTFQTSMEASFGVSGAELGLLNTMFGVLALASYFPGGWLADRFPVRGLLTFSLVATGLGGLAMLSLPGFGGLLAIHAWWGITSILTFWAALIKATRQWGGPQEQGRGFGLLDGGRGAVAALLATGATVAFRFGADTADQLRNVLWVYSLAPILAAAVVWLVLPAHSQPPDQALPSMRLPQATQWRTALAMPQLWFLAAIIFAAYWLYVGAFELPAYAERGYDRTKEFGAVLGTLRDWLRPVAAIGAGLLADRFRSSRIVSLAFGLLVLGYGSLWLMHPEVGGVGVLWIQVGVAASAGFALRGIYFALLEESRIPEHLTGTSVGLVSVLGFTPDVFAFVLSGWFVETYAGTNGYRYYFGLLAGVALVGLLAVVFLRRWLTGRVGRSSQSV